MAHDGGLHRAVQPFHEAIGGRKMAGRPAEMDTTQLRQVVETL
jgi:hypothetical protein